MKTNLYLIHAYDNMYQGSMGMESIIIIEGTLEEARLIGIEESRDVIMSHGAIYRQITDMVDDEIDQNDYFDQDVFEMEYDSILNDYIYEDIVFDLYTMNNENNKDIRILEAEANSNLEEFIKRYGLVEISDPV